MIYDLSNGFQLMQARERLAKLEKKKAVVELSEKKQGRSQSQNRYLHVCLGYFAAQTGNTLDYVKRYYYKIHCNGGLFIISKHDGILGTEVKYLRSTAELSKEEMSVSIDRFRNFASSEAGIYIPSSDETRYVLEMEMEMERYKMYL